MALRSKENINTYTIKAFGDIFFGEDKATVEKKRKNTIKLGSETFYVSYEYKEIGGIQRLVQVNFMIVLKSVNDRAIKERIDELRNIFTERFGKPKWIRKESDGYGTIYSRRHVTYRDKNTLDNLFSNQCKWESDDKRVISIWWREKYEKKLVQEGGWFQEPEHESVREDTLWITIKCKVIEKMFFQEDASQF